MQNESQDIMRSLFADRPKQNAVEWCEQNVDFALNHAYPTEYRGRWDSGFLPFWNEPLLNCFDPNIREQAIWKPSQAGGTENVPLNAIRYAAGCAPRRILYVWGDQKAAEEDFRERIIGGLRCSGVTSEKLDQSRIVEGRVDMPDMTVAAAWPKNKMAFKRNPWSLIIADEFSCYPDLTPGMMRKRCDTVPFSHICWISSADPTMKRGSDDDPIIVEFRSGDQRKWNCVDPETGNLFVFEMGGESVPHGLKWDITAKNNDGSWNFEKVNETAHYITPDGTRIDNDERMDIVRGGQWIATNPDAPGWRRSYHLNAFCMPFKSGDFGNIAVSFLQAKERGADALKVFIYEYLAEPFYETREATEESYVSKRCGDYKKAEYLSDTVEYAEAAKTKEIARILTIDVQKDYFYWLVREWIDGGDSGLVAWGTCIETKELDGIAEEYGCDYGGVDFGYYLREYDVLQYCLEGKAAGNQWLVPLKGNDNLKSSLLFSFRDPYLGKAGEGQSSVETYQWQTDTFRSLFMQMLRGESREKWFVYKGIELDYCKQVTALEKIDGKWSNRRGHTQDHLFDCECMQLVVARVIGLYQNRYIEDIQTKEDEA